MDVELVAFLLFTIQGFLEPQFRPTFVLVQNNNLKREMEQFIIILCYTTYKIMRSHFKVILVLCYFPSDRYFMYFLMKFFFVLSSLSCSLEFSTNYLSMCCRKNGLLHFPRNKVFWSQLSWKVFLLLATLQVWHKNSKIFSAKTFRRENFN